MQKKSSQHPCSAPVYARTYTHPVEMPTPYSQRVLCILCIGSLHSQELAWGHTVFSKDLLRQKDASLSPELLPPWLERDTYGVQGPQRVGAAEHLYLNMGSNAISTDKSLVSWSVAPGQGKDFCSKPDIICYQIHWRGCSLAGGLFPPPDGKYFVQFYYKN